jgi:NTE family protein
VLGAGGVVGTAWMAGLATGLRGLGVDLAVLAEPPRLTSDDIQLPPPDPRLVGRVFAVLGDKELESGVARKRVGQIALETSTDHEPVHVKPMPSSRAVPCQASTRR